MKAFFALTLKMEGMEQPPGQVDQSRAKTTVGKAFHIRGLCKSPPHWREPRAFVRTREGALRRRDVEGNVGKWEPRYAEDGGCRNVYKRDF